MCKIDKKYRIFSNFKISMLIEKQIGILYNQNVLTVKWREK